jgi:hypothetical protein
MEAVHIEGSRHPSICLFETLFSCQCPFKKEDQIFYPFNVSTYLYILELHIVYKLFLFWTTNLDLNTYKYFAILSWGGIAKYFRGSGGKIYAAFNPLFFKNNFNMKKFKISVLRIFEKL